MAGIVNAAAGMLGVIGPVDYSVSPGVIAASGCGSRFPLIPAAGILLLASFSPLVLGVAGAIPPTVVGGILVYTLSGQVAAGLSSALGNETFSFEDGLVIGLPILAGTITAILPPSAIAEFPASLRSVAGNGFVVGVVAVLTGHILKDPGLLLHYHQEADPPPPPEHDPFLHLAAVVRGGEVAPPTTTMETHRNLFFFLFGFFCRLQREGQRVVAQDGGQEFRIQ